MRYGEISIETQRQAPARARNEGSAMLRRAGYTATNGELTKLGRHCRRRLEALANACPPAEFFLRLRLPVIPAEGGEYYYTLDSGRVELAACDACGYAAARPFSHFRKSAPAPEALEPLKKVATPDCHTIDALAAYLGISRERTAKALMYTRNKDKRFVFVVIRGDMQLSEEKLVQQVGSVAAATAGDIVAVGAVPGYASPIALGDALIVVDDLIPRSANLVAGANEAGYHLLNTNCGRDYQPAIVVDLSMAEAGAPCPECGSPLLIRNAEVMAAGDGYHFESILEAAADAHHDEKGLTLPASAAPFDLHLMNVPGREMDTRARAGELHDEWEAAGLALLFDDRNERAGVKFADADLIGCPVRATVGERGMKDGMVELKARSSGETKLVPCADALDAIQSLIRAS